MRLFFSTLLTALFVPLAAYAQAPKQVEVINQPIAVEVRNVEPLAVDITNEPVAVEVVNPPTAIAQRVDFVGVTEPLHPFNLGRLEANAFCQAIYSPESRVCNVADLADSLTLSLGDIPEGGAWFFEKDLTGTSQRSGEFEVASSQELILPTGKVTKVKAEFDPGDPPSIPRPFTCCALVP